MQHRIYTSLYGSADELRDSLHSSDLSEFIYLAQKSTPDYLPNLEEKSGPATNEETRKAYHAYHDQIILPNNNFENNVFPFAGFTFANESVLFTFIRINESVIA